MLRLRSTGVIGLRNASWATGRREAVHPWTRGGQANHEMCDLQGLYGARSDVVHRRAGVLVLALDDVRDRRAGEDLAAGVGGLGEDAGGVAAEGAVEELDDLEDGDVRRVAGEGVATLDPALGAQQARAAQDGEELLEELDRDVGAAGEPSDRGRAGVAPAGELGQSLQGVRALGRDGDHESRLVREMSARRAETRVNGNTHPR